MTKTNYRKKIFSGISVLVSVFIYVGAILVYLYANGWRIDPTNQIFIKTGVLTVQSDPFLSTLYIEEEAKGRTPKSVSLPVGNYNISVSRNGYVEWRKEIEVKEEKSTPVYPWLIKEGISKQNIFLLQDKEYIKSWINETRDYIYFLTKEYITTTNTYKYELYRFDVNTSFWDLSANPKVVLTLDYVSEPNIDLLLSPHGLFGVLTITDLISTKSYLIESSKSSTLDSLTELNISAFGTYSIAWSRNNQYIMFESNQDVISFDVQKQTRYLLLKKIEGSEYVWSTDEQGFFYTIETKPNEENSDIYSYILTQEQMNGSNKKTLIEDLFFQSNKDYILRYREDTGVGKYAPFTNSPESAKSVGKIVSITVNQNAKGIYIKTETSSYWYNMDSKKYHLISPYSSELIQFAPDNYKLIFKDEKGYGVFTFLKEDGDHTVNIGSKRIKDIDINTTNVNWISNSLYIWYVKDNSMYISDRDGENTVKILDEMETLKYYVITFSRDKVYTFLLGEEEIDSPRDILIDSYMIR